MKRVDIRVVSVYVTIEDVVLIPLGTALAYRKGRGALEGIFRLGKHEGVKFATQALRRSTSSCSMSPWYAAMHKVSKLTPLYFLYRAGLAIGFTKPVVAAMAQPETGEKLQSYANSNYPKYACITMN